MKKRFKRKISILLAFIFSLSLCLTPVFANNGLSISANVSSVKVGETFTVTIKASQNVFIEGLKLTVSGGTITKNLSVSSLDKGDTTTAKIKLTGDSCTVKVTGTSANYETEKETSASASVKVTKKTTTTNNNSNTTNNTNNNQTNNTTIKKSDDCSLTSLTIDQGTLSPSFKANKYHYDVALAGDITKVNIQAIPNHNKASLTGTGLKTLKVGDNVYSIICEAENGNKKTYTITFHVDETPLIYIKYKDKDYGVVRNLENITVPNNFVEKTFVLNNQKINGFYNEKLHLYLIYLVDENGNKDFYIVRNDNIVSEFKKIKINEKEYIPLPLTTEKKEIKQLTSTKVMIKDIELNGWIFKEDYLQDYCLVYLMNDEGNESLYSYEKSEGSLQKYTSFQIEEDQEKEPLFENIYFLSSCFFLTTTILTYIYIIYFKKKRIKEIKQYYEKRAKNQ